MTGEPDMQHAAFEILLEKRIRKADSPDEAAKLDGHLSGCERCRQELETIRKEEEMLNQETAAFVEGFDWNAAEQAIRNRVAREKAIGIGPKIIGLLVSLAIFWPIAMMAGWLAYSAVALALIATFAYWEISSRTGRQRLLEKAMRGGEDLVQAYDEHDRELKKERRGERVVVLIGSVVVVGLAAYNAITGGWLGVAIAALFLDFAWTMARSSLSGENRHRNDLLDRGKISWRDYLLWSVREVDGESRLSSKEANRSLWISRTRMVLAYLLLAVLVVERGGVWIAAGVGVALYYIYRVSSMQVQKLRSRRGNDSDPAAS